jgi:hypothetical protein
VKYCIIRKVPFKTPGMKPRIVWANVLCEREGLALVLVPQMDISQSHSIFIASENVAERYFESVTPHYFSLESEDLTEAGNKLRILGKTFESGDFFRHFRPDDFL